MLSNGYPQLGGKKISVLCYWAAFRKVLGYFTRIGIMKMLNNFLFHLEDSECVSIESKPPSARRCLNNRGTGDWEKF
jgi:hypothetical protein